VTGRVLNGGEIGNNKAVTVNRSIGLEPLTDKDQNAITLGKQLGIKHFALSFANTGSNVDLIRSLTGKNAFIISKVESRQALQNLDEIIELSDAILIDRGDLSREVAIEAIPIVQRQVIKRARLKKRSVYVATNLLESMIASPGPTRAEVNDVYSTLEQGASGLVLAAETAIGKHPVASAGMVKRIVSVFQSNDDHGDFWQIEGHSLLNPPLGGVLVQQQANQEQLDESSNSPVLTVDEMVLMDAEQIATGVYSPVEGFMGSETLRLVLEQNTLGNGICWTLPILFQINEEARKKLSVDHCMVLEGRRSKRRFLMRINELFKFDIHDLTQKWFGTDDQRHPGVKQIFDKGDIFVAGKVIALHNATTPDLYHPLTPLQIRSVLTKKEWSQVVGFHTRNAPHRAHEFIMVEALKRCGGDGLLISPILGPKKSGDLLTEPLLESYAALLQSQEFPGDRALLAPFESYPRYSGPREAVFTALCRKNMGCSHFIVGRDHTGVADYYSVDASQRFFNKLGDIGIEPIFFQSIAFDEFDNNYKDEQSCLEPRKINGTEARERLLRKEQLPDWFMSSEVQAALVRFAQLEGTFVHN
jgi:ATP sulfurylase